MLATMTGSSVPVAAEEVTNETEQVGEAGIATTSVYNTGAFTVTGGAGGTDYTYESGVLTVKTETAITIKNTNPATSTTDHIVVDTGAGKTAHITLAGVNISCGSDCAFSIKNESKTQLILQDNSINTLRSGSNGDEVGLAGLEVKQGTTLTIDGTGRLDAFAGSSTFGCAGIGGYANETAGIVIIENGIVTATGGNHGAGIGGAQFGTAGIVEIKGGTVTATGGDSGAGIGGSFDGSGGITTISGGNVTATGGDWGAGIGGGNGAGGTTTISGGNVTATGGKIGAGIGGGKSSAGGTTTISGGIVIATGGDYGAGIGGSFGGSGGTVTISGGMVTTTGGMRAAGIGGGGSNDSSGGGGAGANVTITGGSILATGEDGAENIGGGADT